MTQELKQVGDIPLFEGYGVPPNFISDGCTHCREKWFGVSITHCCYLHDFQREFGICSALDADARLKRNIIATGYRAFAAGAWGDGLSARLKLWFFHLLASKVWLFVKIFRPWFSRTQELPKEYAKYALPQNQ